MVSIPFIAIVGLIAMVATGLVMSRRKAAKQKIIDEARFRAEERPTRKPEIAPTIEGFRVNHYDHLDEDQLKVLALISEGYRPEIKKDGYKFKGTPRNRAAGVPDSYGKDDF